MTPLASGSVEKVGVGVFDAVIVGELGAVGMWIVDGGGAGDHGLELHFDKLRVHGGGG